MARLEMATGGSRGGFGRAACPDSVCRGRTMLNIARSKPTPHRARPVLPSAVFAAILGVWGVTAAAAGRAPNLVLVVADDLGWGDVGFNGRTEWSTPNLDRLAARGLILKRCYAAAPI